MLSPAPALVQRGSGQVSPATGPGSRGRWKCSGHVGAASCVKESPSKQGVLKLGSGSLAKLWTSFHTQVHFSGKRDVRFIQLARKPAHSGADLGLSCSLMIRSN